MFCQVAGNGYCASNSSVATLAGEMIEVGRFSKAASCWPVDRHSSAALDVRLKGRLLSEIGYSSGTGAPFGSTTTKPVRLPSRSMMAVFLSPSRKSPRFTCSV